MATLHTNVQRHPISCQMCERGCFKTNPQMEERTMSKEKIIPNTRQADGSGVPTAPKIDWSGKKEEISPLDRVLAHLRGKHGDQKARAMLKKMSALEVLTLNDSLRKGEQEEEKTGRIKYQGNLEMYTMPKVPWHKKT
jgi:hypothetical protein